MIHEELTRNVRICIGVAFSRKVPQDEAKLSFYVSQKEQGQLIHCWRGLKLEMEEKLAAFLSTDKDIHWVKERICSLQSANVT
jgi:hypothetical protein